jgi:hypothetical protein
MEGELMNLRYEELRRTGCFADQALQDFRRSEEMPKTPRSSGYLVQCEMSWEHPG